MLCGQDRYAIPIPLLVPWLIIDVASKEGNSDIAFSFSIPFSTPAWAEALTALKQCKLYGQMGLKYRTGPDGAQLLVGEFISGIAGEMSKAKYVLQGSRVESQYSSSADPLLSVQWDIATLCKKGIKNPEYRLKLIKDANTAKLDKLLRGKVSAASKEGMADPLVSGQPLIILGMSIPMAK